MAAKRKFRQQQKEKQETKKSRMADDEDQHRRLDNLPESLQSHILSFLDAKEAVQTSVLSKPWISLWTSMPILNLTFASFYKLRAFDQFVYNVLRHRDQTANLNTLTFTRDGVSSAKILKKVLEYAFANGVHHLEIFIVSCRKDSFPVCRYSSSDSLKTLKLKSNCYVTCPFLMGSFKNLTVLYLTRVIIENLEPFSGFPMLEKLALKYCRIGKVLNVKASKLTDLTIASHGCLDCCELTTPNLRFFEYNGAGFPRLRSDDGLPVLETVVIDFHVVCKQIHEKRVFDELISLFWGVENAKSVTLFSSIVDLLCLFPEKLVNDLSPFWKLECLNVDLRFLHFQNLFERKRSWSIEMVEMVVKDYLLQKSPKAKFNINYPLSNFSVSKTISYTC